MRPTVGRLRYRRDRPGAPPSRRVQPYRRSSLVLELRLVGLGVVDAAAVAVLALALAGHRHDDPVAALLAHVRVDPLPVAGLCNLAARPAGLGPLVGPCPRGPGGGGGGRPGGGGGGPPPGSAGTLS